MKQIIHCSNSEKRLFKLFNVTAPNDENVRTGANHTIRYNQPRNLRRSSVLSNFVHEIVIEYFGSRRGADDLRHVVTCAEQVEILGEFKGLKV